MQQKDNSIGRSAALATALKPGNLKIRVLCVSPGREPRSTLIQPWAMDLAQPNLRPTLKDNSEYFGLQETHTCRLTGAIPRRGTRAKCKYGNVPPFSSEDSTSCRSSYQASSSQLDRVPKEKGNDSAAILAVGSGSLEKCSQGSRGGWNKLHKACKQFLL